MLDAFRNSEYVGYRDAASPILERFDGSEAIAKFGLDDLLAESTDIRETLPILAFLEAQGHHRGTTPILGQLPLIGVVPPRRENLVLALPYGSSEGGALAAPGVVDGTRVVADRSKVGLVELRIPASSEPACSEEVGDDYLRRIDADSVEYDAVIVADADLCDHRSSIAAIAALGASAEILGVVTRLLTDATEYAQQREQFGRPIASNQSLQHLLAWAATERHRLVSLYDLTVARLQDGALTLDLALIVKATAGRVVHQVAQSAIQVTGGISFTWEYPQHRHHRRGLVLDQVAGPSADLTVRLGRKIRTEGSFPLHFSLDQQLT